VRGVTQRTVPYQARVERNIPVRVGPAPVPLSFVYVQDVASAVLAVMDAPKVCVQHAAAPPACEVPKPPLAHTGKGERASFQFGQSRVRLCCGVWVLTTDHAFITTFGRRVTLAEYVLLIVRFYEGRRKIASNNDNNDTSVIVTVPQGRATDDFFPSVECGPIDVSKVRRRWRVRVGVERGHVVESVYECVLFVRPWRCSSGRLPPSTCGSHARVSGTRAIAARRFLLTIAIHGSMFYAGTVIIEER
jgi:hypothetical protein